MLGYLHPDPDSPKLGPLYFDLDGEDLAAVRDDAVKVCCYLQGVMGVPFEYLHIYFSGSKGIHILVPTECLGLTPHVRLHEVYRLIANDVVASNTVRNSTLDMQIYDTRRLLRLPLSRHSLTGLYKVPLTYGELRNLTADEIAALAKSPRYIPKPAASLCLRARSQALYYMGKINKVNASKKALPQAPRWKETPPCVKWLLNHPPRKGNRNNSAIVLASFMYQGGMTQEEVATVLAAWAARCSPPMDIREVNSIAERADRYAYTCASMRQLSQCDRAKCEFVPYAVRRQFGRV